VAGVTDKCPANVSALTLRARVFLHTGSAEAREGDYVGACLNRMGRLHKTEHGARRCCRGTYELVCEATPVGAGLRDLSAHCPRDLAARNFIAWRTTRSGARMA
jgi:hypothetical protein